jgi:hypothetical protein
MALTATHLVAKVIAVVAQTNQLLPADHVCGGDRILGDAYKGYGGL